MSSPYRSFKELADQELEGQGYQIKMNLRDSPVLVMAPHGGKIEPGTTEIAEAIAGQDHSFYSFEGLKTDGNGVLYIESHLFDEPRALKAVEKAKIVVTVHGQINRKDAFVMVGGLNAPLCSEIKRQLKASGFQTRSPIEGLMGLTRRISAIKGILSVAFNWRLAEKYVIHLERIKINSKDLLML